MMFSQKGLQRKQKTVIPTLFLFILLAAIFGFFTKASWDMYGRYQESVARRDLVQEEYDSLTERIDSMQASVASFETKEGKEQMVRESYNVVKEGEQVAIIIEKDIEVEEISEKVPWYRKVLNTLWFR